MANGSGRWDTTTDLGSDETVAMPDDLSGATSASQADYWYLAGLTYGTTTTTTV